MTKVCLKLPDSTQYPAFLQSLLASVSKEIDVQKSRDLEKAIEVATYLQVLEVGSDFNDFLKSFVYDIQYSEKGYSWAHKCDGLSLLAYDSELKGDEQERLKAINVMASKNFDKDDISWLIENAHDDLEFNVSDDETYERIKGRLTTKEKAQGHYSKIVKFSYYYSMIKNFGDGSEADLVAAIKCVVENERGRLRDLLVKS